LFLDEPTSGVDPITRRAFWDLIYALALDGTTILVSTHYMEEAEYCNRLALMNRGLLIALDTPARLRAGVRDPVLEVRTESGLRAVEVLTGAPGVLAVGMYGRAVHVTVHDGPDVVGSIRSLLASRGVACEHVARIEPTLEHAFIAAVQESGGVVAG